MNLIFYGLLIGAEKKRLIYKNAGEKKEMPVSTSLFQSRNQLFRIEN
jgi:hypothetical protein